MDLSPIKIMAQKAKEDYAHLKEVSDKCQTILDLCESIESLSLSDDQKELTVQKLNKWLILEP